MAFQVTEPARDLIDQAHMPAGTTHVLRQGKGGHVIRHVRELWRQDDGRYMVRHLDGAWAGDARPVSGLLLTPVDDALPAHPASAAGESAAAPSAACGVPVDPCSAGTPSNLSAHPSGRPAMGLPVMPGDEKAARERSGNRAATFLSEAKA